MSERRSWPLRGLVPICLALAQLVGCSGAGRTTDELMVFAAASLRDVLTEIAADFETETGLAVAFNFAGSNVLALQIEAARGADIYLSANEQWMDYLEERDLLEADSRRTFLSNRLAVIAHQSSAVELDELGDLAEADFRYLSVANPEAVPAGHYAKELLSRIDSEGTDLWTLLGPRITPAPDVRAALAMVESRRDVVGVVYLTDARSSSAVRVLTLASEPPGPNIQYSAAAILDGSSRAGAFLDFLGGERAGAVFDAHGFARTPASG